MTNETKAPEALLPKEGFQIIFVSCIINELKLFVTQKLCNWNMFALYVADNYQGTLEVKNSTFIQHFLFGEQKKFFTLRKLEITCRGMGEERESQQPTMRKQGCE